MANFVCRDCGAESNHWHAGHRCIHCGASERSRITETQVASELAALGVLYGSEEKRGESFEAFRQRVARRVSGAREANKQASFAFTSPAKGPENGGT